jgi:hypothetical protein
VTCVDRIVGERRVSPGRRAGVTTVDGDQIEVTIIGVGIVRYACAELSRVVSVVVWVPRRADAWISLA